MPIRGLRIGNGTLPHGHTKPPRKRSRARLSLRDCASDATKREAFTYVENAKSRALADLIAFHASSLPPRRLHQRELVDRIRRLRQELNWYYKEIDASELESRACGRIGQRRADLGRAWSRASA